jgi:purine-binding chemotaxis protein CheW
MASRTQRLAQSLAPAIAPDEEAAEHALLFQLGGAAFAFRLSEVAEIIRAPVLTRMPLVPPSLLGLANLRGVVLPVVSLRRLLRLPDAPPDDAARVIVLRGEVPVGFMVDRVDHLAAIRAGADDGDVDADGAVTIAAGGSTGKLLDPQRLLSGPFGRLGLSGVRTASPATAAARAPAAQNAAAAQALVSLLGFDVGRQEYALPLHSVREIVPLPDHIAEVAHSETAVLGVMTLRERLLPLVSLRTLLGFPPGERRDQRGKVVVLSLGGGVVGVVVDATREILRVGADAIDAAPALLTRGDGDAEIVSICRLDQGRRLVALLSPERLFRADVVRRILAEQGGVSGDAMTQTEANSMADEQFIVFRLGGQDYGMPIAAVSEVVRPPEHITRLPKAPAFIDGVMNLRGAVVPVVDLGRRLDVAAAEQAGARRILVVAIGGARAGFVVDSVSGIVKASMDAIRPAPDLSAAQMRLISRVVNFESQHRMILLVEPANLLDQLETDVLVQFQRSDGDLASSARD